MNKISKEFKKSGLIIAEEIPVLFNPEITTNPIPIVVKFFQRVAGKRISQFIADYKEKKIKGQIKNEDEFLTEQPTLTLAELFKILAQEPSDEDRFKALKSIFFTSIANDSTKEDEVLAYEFLQSAKKLSGTEMLILKANFEIVKTGVPEIKESLAFYSRSAWRKLVAKYMGQENYDSLVGKYEKNLESLGLISPRHEQDNRQTEFESTRYFRLTEIGMKFCKFITQFS